jgi:hypothetical protein
MILLILSKAKDIALANLWQERGIVLVVQLSIFRVFVCSLAIVYATKLPLLQLSSLVDRAEDAGLIGLLLEQGDPVLVFQQKLSAMLLEIGQPSSRRTA